MVNWTINTFQTCKTFTLLSTPDIRSSNVISFSYLATAVKERYRKLSYLHVIEPRVQAGKGSIEILPTAESNDFLRDIWGFESYYAAGGFEREEAMETADNKSGLIAMDRHFIANVSPPESNDVNKN